MAQCFRLLPLFGRPVSRTCAPAGGGWEPANALVLNGQPLTLNGQVLTLGA